MRGIYRESKASKVIKQLKQSKTEKYQRIKACDINERKTKRFKTDRALQEYYVEEMYLQTKMKKLKFKTGELSKGIKFDTVSAE